MSLLHNSTRSVSAFPKKENYRFFGENVKDDPREITAAGSAAKNSRMRFTDPTAYTAVRWLPLDDEVREVNLQKCICALLHRLR
jgi:hypothetical protein